MTHWAAPYIDKAWSPDGAGPQSYSCWGLVRAVFLAHHGIDLPFVAVGEETPGNVKAIKTAAEVSGLRRVVGRMPRDGEIIVLQTPIELHCGLAAVANGKLGLLDSTEARGVRWHAWADVVDCPFELWGWP